MTIASQFGGRHHSTIIYFRDQGVRRRDGRDPAFRLLTDKLAAAFREEAL